MFFKKPPPILGEKLIAEQIEEEFSQKFEQEFKKGKL